MKNSIQFIFLFLIFAQCKSPEEKFLAANLLDTASYESYLKKVHKADNAVSDSFSFFFFNNPAGIDSTNNIIIIINGFAVYSGKYDVVGSLLLPVSLRDSNSQPLHAQLLVFKDNRLYLFTNKSIFHWLDCHKFLFIGFSPMNQVENRIHFFPASQIY